MQRIEQRLRLGMGLDAATVGSSSLQRTIRLCMKAAGVDTPQEYEQLIATSAAEWNQLVEAVVVTETWFFRDRQAFAALANMILMDRLPAHATGRARILSLPCSSGEEPYSISMALIDAGIPAARFAVDAVDLSQHVLEKALSGVYGKNSFRGQDLAFRDRHFTPDGEKFYVKQTIRDCVTFKQANLLGDEFPFARSSFEFVFCRNLLIYFDRETQRRAFQRLESLLVPGGTVFLGPAEVPLALEAGFSGINLPMAFACRRTAETPSARRIVPARKPSVAARPLPAPLPLPASPVLSKAKAAPALDSDVDALLAARQHADGGRLDEAVRMCRSHLDQRGASVDAYYLLGVIHDALGQAEARDFYRKALYLDPNHYESLLQLSLHAERDGDHTGARNLRRRAQRQQTKP